MASTIILVLVFLVPGYLVHRLTRIRTATFLLSFSWSWLVLIGCVAVSGMIGLSNIETLACYLGVALLLLVSVVSTDRPPFKQHPTPGGAHRKIGKAVIIWLSLLILVTLYQSIAGVYLELPADVYAHLDHMKEEYAAIAKDRAVTSMSLADLFDKTSRHWYRAVAWIAYFLGRPVGVFQESLALVNVLFLVSGMYWFALTVFARLRWSLRWKLAVVVAGSVFFIVCHGVNVFSFVRYYALAPISTSLVIHFAALAMFIAACVRARSNSLVSLPVHGGSDHTFAGGGFYRGYPGVNECGDRDR
jgi:hypothetical protein